jgi:hypothetical protein
MLMARRTLQNVWQGRVFASPPAPRRAPPLWNFRKEWKKSLSIRRVERFSKRNLRKSLPAAAHFGVPARELRARSLERRLWLAPDFLL